MYGAGRGHDSNYLICKKDEKDKVLGVLRLVNPWRQRSGPGVDMPFFLAVPAERLAHEWDCLSRGAPLGLTPRPLWRCEGVANFCAYLPYKTLKTHMEQSREEKAAWKLAARATPRISALHRAGLTHMDISMENILADDSLAELVFIDFEYLPVPGLPPAAQRLYDHLRLIESTWKFIPPQERDDFAEWLDAFAKAVAEDEEMAQADMTPLLPALSRMMAAPKLKAAILSVLGARYGNERKTETA
jgi:hypothetical protein